MNQHIDNATITEERKRRILSPRTAIFFFISIALMIILLNRIDFGETYATFKNANITLLLFACCSYLISGYFKALRFRVLLHDIKISISQLFIITSYHNFFNMILPARTGELTLIYYLNKIGNTDMSKGLHSLIIVRLFDFIIVPVFFIVSLIIYFGKDSSMVLIAAAIVFFALTCLALFNIKWIMFAFNKMFTTITNRMKIHDHPIIKKIHSMINRVLDEFVDFNTSRYIPGLMLTSILIWFHLYLFFFIVIRALGIDINFFQSVAGATGGVITNIIPVNSFGSFGTLEAGWTGGFMIVGMTEQHAITTGFGSHLVTLCASAIISSVCFIFRWILNRK